MHLILSMMMMGIVSILCGRRLGLVAVKDLPPSCTVLRCSLHPVADPSGSVVSFVGDPTYTVTNNEHSHYYYCYHHPTVRLLPIIPGSLCRRHSQKRSCTFDILLNFPSISAKLYIAIRQGFS